MPVPRRRERRIEAVSGLLGGNWSQKVHRVLDLIRWRPEAINEFPVLRTKI